MWRAISFVLTAIVFLISGSSARAQGCATILTPHFSLYTNVTRNGKTIYTSVTMQGYASIGSSAGCNMSAATHHVGAENVLNGVAHWSYSANGCPSCSFSVTNNEQIVGNPGTNYPFSFEGDAICSMVGQFSTIQPPGGQLPGCVAPATETTAGAGSIAGTSYSNFNQTISDSADDSFDGKEVQEAAPNPNNGQDTCHFAGSQYPAETEISGGTWPVAGGDVAGQHNHWGYDTVGWSPQEVTYYRANVQGHGIGLPCGWTWWQLMLIQCSAGVWGTYTPSTGNKLTSTIEQTNVVNCRYDINGSACQTAAY